jgi:hypothetical protein
VTLGFPITLGLIVNTSSTPAIVSPDPDNTVTVLPPPDLVLNGINRWVPGTQITLSANPVAGYANTMWYRSNSFGETDEEAGAEDVEYGFALNADTVVTAVFIEPTLSVDLNVKGCPALNEKFDWTFEESDAVDTVPATFNHVAIKTFQMGVFKIDDSKLQTSGDATYNDYVDMQINGIDVSYDEGETWEDIGKAYLSFKLNRNQSSLLCKKKIITSPFLMLKEETNNKGSQLFYHDLYRRQDYPNCFEISHYICIFNIKSINKLNNNMYNNETIYYSIGDVIDIDEKKDLDCFEGR